jgi:uracil-DNA glycosylase family 4
MKQLKKLYQAYEEQFTNMKAPDGIIIDTKRVIDKTVFFPAGDGLYYEEETPTHIEYMIIGQDFDTIDKFRALLKDNKSELETGNTTWRNLLKLLSDAGIDKKAVFYTNAIMGYRDGGKNTGKSPAFKDKDFIKACRDFMIEQISMVKPRKIIVLGANLFDFMAALSDDLKAIKDIKKFKDLDKRVYRGVTFKNVDDYKCDLLFMLHPSLFYANAREMKDTYLQELTNLK